MYEVNSSTEKLKKKYIVVNKIIFIYYTNITHRKCQPLNLTQILMYVVLLLWH